MADTVQVQVLLDGPRHLVVLLTNVSDGTGETTAVKKVDKDATSHLATAAAGSAHKISSNAVVDKLSVVEVEYDVQGYEYVRLDWDATTDDEICFISDQGYLDFRDIGAFHDPQSTGNTGDIMLTTSAAVAGDSYSIKLKLKKKYA